MKFFNLLMKELKELINAQMIAGLVLTMVIFMVMGNVMSNSMDELTKEEYTVTIDDRDNTELTAQLMDYLRESGAEIEECDTEGDDYGSILKERGSENLVIIPEGFTETVESGQQAQLITVSRLKSASALSNLSSDTSLAVDSISSGISHFIAERYNLSEEEISVMNNPIVLNENTVVGEKSANISPDSIISKVMTQNMIMPIIVFVLIMMVSQMIISAIANEKIDKTLETLLSTPVSRTAIIGAKMLGAAIVALLNAIFYMVGFSSFMSDMTNTGAESAAGNAVAGQLSMTTQSAMLRLGISLGITDYILIGVQLFLTILICLAVSIMLGALVNDTKSSQTVMMPLMILAMIPYLISMLSDINSLPLALRIILYAIPFTHTFSAMPNLMFGNTAVFFGGLAYQTVVFLICMYFAQRLFKSDKILTMSLNFGQKSKMKKAKTVE